MTETLHYTTTGESHPFHIVRPSPWPLLAAFSAGFTAFGAVTFFHDKILWPLLVAACALVLVAALWFRDIIREATFEHAHSATVKKGFRYGMLLFIVSEVSFFGAFFWAYFNSALIPKEAIGFVWPPKGIQTVNPFDLPFLMTMILLLSGCTVTWAHSAVIQGNKRDLVRGLIATVCLGMMFTGFQAWEYCHAEFGFKETVYASTFYMATGFHGFHVIIGTIFLAVCLFRANRGDFKPNDHFGFEAAAWYWHFVDVVWLFLFIAIYWWGSA
jgi:cytochrome c oxidase subunit 3